MADLPDREQVLGALKRLSSLLFSLGIIVVFVLLALVIATYVFDPLMFQAAADSPQTIVADEPQVFESTTTSMGCAPNATGNASIDSYQFLGARHFTITGNVTLPDAADELTGPTITRSSNHTFVIAVESHPTPSPDRGCRGLARYTAKIQLPYGTNNYELSVRHGGNRTLHIVERS